MGFSDIMKIVERDKYSINNQIKIMQEGKLKAIGGQELVDFYNSHNIEYSILERTALKGYSIYDIERMIHRKIGSMTDSEILYCMMTINEFG
jgi:hypothetical protein